MINVEQFERLFAEVPTICRRYGIAPLDIRDVACRAVNPKIPFGSLGHESGPARGVVALTISLSGDSRVEGPN